MSVVRRLLRGPWDLVQRTAPGLAAWVRRRRASRGGAAVEGTHPAARDEDLRLVADQLAVLSARVDGAEPALDTAEAERIAAARLSALAFYEERITRLEERLAALEAERGRRS